MQMHGTSGTLGNHHISEEEVEMRRNENDNDNRLSRVYAVSHGP